MAIKLVVGLQNPGSSYERTRHNAGGWFARALVGRIGADLRPHKVFQGDVASLVLDGHAFHVLLPTTWMNQCGRSVRSLCQFYRIALDEVLIAHDELDLPVGTARLKTGGGHGGHNGLRDVIAHAGGRDFHRLRLGIGHPGHQDLVTDYVLGKPSQDEKQHIDAAIVQAMDVMPDVLEGKFSKAMTELHQKNKPKTELKKE
jgi:peptidyl-tRNA hydrolase, PTH1 family